MCACPSTPDADPTVAALPYCDIAGNALSRAKASRARLPPLLAGVASAMNSGGSRTHDGIGITGGRSSSVRTARSWHLQRTASGRAIRSASGPRMTTGCTSSSAMQVCTPSCRRMISRCSPAREIAMATPCRRRASAKLHRAWRASRHETQLSSCASR